MADTNTGALTAAQTITYMDALASVFKAQYANIGIGASTESGTLALKAMAARAAILGDGSTLYGVGNAVLQANVKDALASLVSNSRYDAFFASRCRSLVTAIESQIQSNLPSGWTFTGSAQTHALDSHLLRLNAMNADVPTTPASAGTLTAATTAGGGIATCASGSGPRVVHTLVGANLWNESLPSAQATQVALAGSQNSYTYQVSGTVPTGATYMRIYRGYVGGGSSIYFYDQQVAVTPGGSYPAVTITQPDNALRLDWTPPSWASCLMVPEAAAVFALAFASAAGSTGAAVNPLVFSSGGQLSANNVVLTPSSGFVGIGNPAQTAIFGTKVVGTGYTQGAIASANLYSTNTQGFVGAGGAANIIQARVTSALNAAGTLTITYSYYDASHGYGSAQSTTSASATFSGTAVGSTAVITIANGRIVTAITATTDTTTTSGTYILEAVAPRSY